MRKTVIKSTVPDFMRIKFYGEQSKKKYTESIIHSFNPLVNGFRDPVASGKSDFSRNR
jgi:hypothetical protein